MTSRTHDAIAFAFLITVAAVFPPENLNLPTLLIAVIAADVGTAIPDMDSAGNRLWHMLPAGERTGKVLRRVFYKHRTLTHSIVGTYIIYKILEYILIKFLNPAFLDPNIILISLMVGYVSHIVADSFTEEGVPLLFPFKFTFGIPPFRPIRIKTGQWFENFIIYPGVWLYLLWFINANQGELINVLKLVSSNN